MGRSNSNCALTASRTRSTAPPEVLGDTAAALRGRSVSHRQVEDQDLGVAVSLDREAILSRHRGPVALAERGVVEADGTTRDLYPGRPARPQRELDALAGREARGVYRGVLEDAPGAGLRLTSGDLPQHTVLERHDLLVVPRRQAPALGQYPDLEQAHRFQRRGVELAVLDAGAGAHDLYLGGTESRTGTEAV